jgi:hypothetical protein
MPFTDENLLGVVGPSDGSEEPFLFTTNGEYRS